MGAKPSRSRENTPRSSEAAPAELPAAAALKKTKQENKQESGTALIAKLEAEGPYTFWYSLDANSSEHLQSITISCEQEFYECRYAQKCIYIKCVGHCWAWPWQSNMEGHEGLG